MRMLFDLLWRGKGETAVTVAYTVIFILSLLLPLGYLLFLRKKQREPWLFLLFLCVSLTNLGWMLLSLSKTVAFALFANKIAYLGQIFIIVCMFMIIVRLCGFKLKKRVSLVLMLIAALMFGLICTTGHMGWYYKSVTLTYADGAAKLVKEYGPVHPVYTVYVLLFFAAMLTCIALGLKRSRQASPKLAGLMLAVVMGNIGMWLIEKLVTWNFEFLAISYLMSEWVFFFVYILLLDYIHISQIPAPAVIEQPAVIVVETTDRAEQLQQIVASLPEGTSLSPRQMDVLEGILSGKSRKEIAAGLHLSENTVKMHTSALFRALEVSSREEIFALLRK